MRLIASELIASKLIANDHVLRLHCTITLSHVNRTMYSFDLILKVVFLFQSFLVITVYMGGLNVKYKYKYSQILEY